MAPLLIGINLSLFPFPVTFIIDSLKYKSETFNVISSETLRPQLYKISIIALFLILFFRFLYSSAQPSNQNIAIHPAWTHTRVSHEFIPRILAREKPAGKL